MKVWMTTFALTVALYGVPAAQAQVTIDVAKISCQQFLIDKVAPTKSIVLWLSGYYNGQRNNTLVDVGTLEKNADKVEDYCRLNQQVTVMDAVKNALGVGK